MFTTQLLIIFHPIKQAVLRIRQVGKLIYLVMA